MEFNQEQFDELTSGLAYSAGFVPYSQSRHYGVWESINWRVSLTRHNVTLATDYAQGIGHLPKWIQRKRRELGGNVKSIASQEFLLRILETGKVFDGPRIEKPALRDVLYSLLSDSDVMDYASFEDWAESYGFDTDSRSAEKTYRQCLEHGLKLRAMLGDETIRQLRELFQDY